MVSLWVRQPLVQTAHERPGIQAVAALALRHSTRIIAAAPASSGRLAPALVMLRHHQWTGQDCV